MADDDANQNQRIFHLEAQLAETRAGQHAMHEQIASNTAMIQAVKTDTEQVIALLKGSKIFAQMLKWAIGIAASIAAIWAALKGGR